MPTTEDDEMPLRKIDIPDPKDPPSGCRFHTRCPEAREACKRESPEPVEAAPEQEVACFREYDEDHPYWESAPLTDDDAVEADEGTRGASADD